MNRRQHAELRRVRRRQQLGAEPLVSDFQRYVGKGAADIDPQTRFALIRHASKPRFILHNGAQSSARRAPESTVACSEWLTWKSKTVNMGGGGRSGRAEPVNRRHQRGRP